MNVLLRWLAFNRTIPVWLLSNGGTRMSLIWIIQRGCTENTNAQAICIWTEAIYHFRVITSGPNYSCTASPKIFRSSFIYLVMSHSDESMQQWVYRWHINNNNNGIIPTRQHPPNQACLLRNFTRSISICQFVDVLNALTFYITWMVRLVCTSPILQLNSYFDASPPVQREHD